MHWLHHIIEQWGYSNEEHINIINLGSSWNHWCYCAQHFSVFSLPRSVSTLHQDFTHALHVFYHAYHFSHGHYHGITPMIAESRPRSRPWRVNFSPRVVLNALAEREFVIFVLFFLHSLIFKWIMNLNMLWLEAFIEGFTYTIQINRPCPLRGHQ